MNKKLIILTSVLSILLFSFIGCKKNANTKALQPVTQIERTNEVQAKTVTEVKQEKKEELKALDFSLEMTDGKVFTLLENIDKPILVNYWATWCPPCVREFPDLEEMYKNYKDKMNFIAVNSAETKSVIEAFMTKNKFTIPVAMDSDNRVGMMYGIQSIPTTFIVNTEGVIVFAQLGMMTKTQMKQAIESSL